jgi:integrase
MARHATGELRHLSDGFAAVITIEGRARRAFRLSACRTDDEARARCKALSAMAVRLRHAGHGGQIEQVLGIGAKARAGRPWDAVCAAVDALCSGQTRECAEQVPTFEDFAHEWTSGRLARRHPDHVPTKKTSDDDERLLKLYVNPVLDGLGLDRITLSEADQVMANLPEHLSPSSRRHVGQVVRRVLSLAVYPARHIKENPIPRGWLPRGRSVKAFTCLWPQEETALMATQSVPLVRRLFFGMLAREGMRRDEAASLRWCDLNLDRGVIRLDENKTDDPRAWALDPGVVRALKAWRSGHGVRDRPQDPVFQEEGRRLYVDQLARQLRGDLNAAGATRAELFERSAVRQPIRVHDLRATFVTVSLANGKTETWVADRTGHRSSAMINRYRRAARTWAELALGSLAPLDEAIPELSLPPPLPLEPPSGGGPTTAKCSGEQGIRTLGTLAGTPDFEATKHVRAFRDKREIKGDRRSEWTPDRPCWTRRGAILGQSGRAEQGVY